MYNKEELLDKIKGHKCIEEHTDLLLQLIDDIDDFNEKYADRFADVYIDFVNESTGNECDPYESFNLKFKKNYKSEDNTVSVIISELSIKELDIAIYCLNKYFEELNGIQKCVRKSIKDSNEKIHKQIEEYNKNNEIFFKKIDGFTHSSLDTFTQQLLDGQLHDINRIEDVILKLKDNDCDVYSQHWINDYALVKLLRYYYNKCIDLEIKLKLAEDKNIVDSIIYKQ